MNICILDNFDSFTFNLLDEFHAPENKIFIWRNSINAELAEQKILSLSSPKLLVLSPGPGHPDDAGCMNELITRLSGKVPIFGVCLGMQSIVSSFGGQVGEAKSIVHGKARILLHEQESIFAGLKNRLSIGRYHSLAARTLPDCLKIIATCDTEIMAVSHKDMPIIGLQFHPESILSTYGSKIIENVILWAKDNS